MACRLCVKISKEGYLTGYIEATIEDTRYWVGRPQSTMPKNKAMCQFDDLARISHSDSQTIHKLIHRICDHCLFQHSRVKGL
jgi:hypothetical protein